MIQKIWMICLLTLLLWGCSPSTEDPFLSKKIDLTPQWDTLRPLANPDKGWYHHMLDNGIHKYLIQNDDDLLRFPGMDHLYLRLAWAYLEPEEGKFDWSYIDKIVEKYIPMGYKISFRITCKETGGAPGSVPKEINGIKYATPYWVMNAGAQGIDRPSFGNSSWTPVWGDTVFLEKLDHFHKAFAERYDGKPWVRYIDVGSIGDWGEGHTYSSTRVPATIEEIKSHLNLHLKHYKKTPLVISDGLVAFKQSKEAQEELLRYALEHGISLRDDSPMVKYLMENYLQLWTVAHPEFFAAAFKSKPIIYELEHYGTVKKNGHWIGKNGEGVIPQLGVSGAAVFRNSIKIMHPTYIGFHGYLGEWLKDNPDLTGELLNLCGYWYFPKSIHVRHYQNRRLTFEMEWMNKGVAPAYSTYSLKGKLIPSDKKSRVIEFEIADSGNQKWMPNEVATQGYTIHLSEDFQGEYALALQLFDPISKKPVDMGLSTKIKEDDYYLLQKLKINQNN